MAFLGVHVDAEAARQLAQISIPGGGSLKATPSGDHHVTMIYFGKDVPQAAVLRAIERTAMVCQKAPPMRMTVGRAGCFSPDPEDGVPIIGHVDSPPLTKLRARLADDFDREGIPYSKKWPEYRPHVTLAYGTRSVPDFALEPPITIDVEELCLWSGPRGSDLFRTTFPLRGGPRLDHLIREARRALYS